VTIGRCCYQGLVLIFHVLRYKGMGSLRWIFSIQNVTAKHTVYDPYESKWLFRPCLKSKSKVITIYDTSCTTPVGNIPFPATTDLKIIIHKSEISQHQLSFWVKMTDLTMTKTKTKVIITCNTSSTTSWGNMNLPDTRILKRTVIYTALILPLGS
jgi:hypothetical protein